MLVGRDGGRVGRGFGVRVIPGRDEGVETTTILEFQFECLGEDGGTFGDGWTWTVSKSSVVMAT